MNKVFSVNYINYSGRNSTHIGIESQTWCEAHGEIGESTHEEGGKGSDGGGRCDQVLANFVLA